MCIGNHFATSIAIHTEIKDEIPIIFLHMAIKNTHKTVEILLHPNKNCIYQNMIDAENS